MDRGSEASVLWASVLPVARPVMSTVKTLGLLLTLVYWMPENFFNSVYDGHEMTLMPSASFESSIN